MIQLSFTVNHTYESLIMLCFICFTSQSTYVSEQCFWSVSEWCQLKQQDPTNTYKGIKCWQRRPEKFSLSRVDGQGFSASCSWQKWYRWFELALNPLSWDTVRLCSPLRSSTLGWLRALLRKLHCMWFQCLSWQCGWNLPAVSLRKAHLIVEEKWEASAPNSILRSSCNGGNISQSTLLWNPAQTCWFWASLAGKHGHWRRPVSRILHLPHMSVAVVIYAT